MKGKGWHHVHSLDSPLKNYYVIDAPELGTDSDALFRQYIEYGRAP